MTTTPDTIPDRAELPPLPKAAHVVHTHSELGDIDLFTVDQMHAHALAARSLAGTPQADPLKAAPDAVSEREAFEIDAEPMGFDLTRHACAAPEPWSEYADESTGHRWGGWLARAERPTTHQAAKNAAASDLHAPMPTLAAIDDEASNGFRVVLHFATEGEADDAHSFYLVAARRAAAKSAAASACPLGLEGSACVCGVRVCASCVASDAAAHSAAPAADAEVNQ